MKVGTKLKWKEPLNEDEKNERFEVLEDRGTRVLVVCTSCVSMPIKPTACWHKDMLEEVE